MGHQFGLAHPNFFQPGCQNQEHSPRNPTDPNFNANSYGDMVADTHIEVSPSYIDSNCGYIGGGSDCLGIPVVAETINGFLIEPGYNNFMYATGSLSSCTTPILTPGQGVRMRNFIVGYYANYFQERMNTIKSLYEPFDRINIIGNVKSITDNYNGTANVCRFYTQSFRFQKGFDYIFPENLTPDEVNYGTNDLPSIMNPPFNCPIVIQQLGMIDGEFPVGNAFTIDKGFKCEDEPFVAGLDIVTSDLGSYIFTILEWDNLKASDPHFYQFLENNKYHIIKRETAKGVVLQIILYKN